MSITTANYKFMLDAEAMVKDMTNGITGFNNEEIKEILAYVTNILMQLLFNFHFKLIKSVHLFNIFFFLSFFKIIFYFHLMWDMIHTGVMRQSIHHQC